MGRRRTAREIETEIETRLEEGRTRRPGAPRVPTNTLDEMRAIPGVVVGAAVNMEFQEKSSLIVAQEARGQAEMELSDTLPTRGLRSLIESGAQITTGAQPDRLLTLVRLPDGWSKRRTDHHLYTDLLDEKGRKRASIFFKASFHDRDAFVTPCRRLSTRRDWDLEKKSKRYAAEALDGETVIFRTEERTIPEGNTDRMAEFTIGREVEAEAAEWLNRSYPGWEKASSYWEFDALPEPKPSLIEEIRRVAAEVAKKEY